MPLGFTVTLVSGLGSTPQGAPDGCQEPRIARNRKAGLANHLALWVHTARRPVIDVAKLCKRLSHIFQETAHPSTECLHSATPCGRCSTRETGGTEQKCAIARRSGCS
jgi:hypothetical protein